MENELLQQQEEAQFESLIQGLLEQGYGHCPDFLSQEVVGGLRANLLQYRDSGLMHPAGIGKRFDFQKNIQVRGDLIKWLEKESPDFFESFFMQKVERLVNYLNQTCYTSINAYEFHYANYEANSFYKRHLDQFKADKGRKFSLVIYLNKDWREEDGGMLSLYLDEEKVVKILPTGGSAVFFKSDELEHEVHPSFHRERISIAGWLKNI